MISNCFRTAAAAAQLALVVAVLTATTAYTASIQQSAPVTISTGVIDTRIHFYCVHSRNRQYVEVFQNDVNLASKIDISKPVAFIVHGWLDRFQSRITHSPQIIEDWSRFADTNACGVDWNALSVADYITAAYTNTDLVAKVIANFVVFLNGSGIPYDRISIAGHSLGAHVAAFAAKRIHERTDQRIDAVYGLDPAGPLFNFPRIFAENSTILQQSLHANYVQVMYTAINTLGLGMASYGSVAAGFVVNGGFYQPGCDEQLILGLPLPPVCSHIRAIEYFQSSLNPEHLFIGTGFFGSENDRMGIWSNRLAGHFSVTTEKVAPFCVGCVKDDGLND